MRTELAEKHNLFVLNDNLTCYGANGIYTTKVYLTGLFLPNGTVIHELSVSGFPAPPEFDMLIGMDVITRGDFLISTENGMPMFSFQIPSYGGFAINDIQSVKTRNGIVSLGKTYISPVKHEKIGRNALCPCGSGKKYKNCCGKGA